MPDTPLYFVQLAFADKSRAGEHMDGHNAWIDQGFEDGTFLMTGTIPGRGGAVLAHGVTHAEITERVQQDPFVKHGVVTAEIAEVVPSRLHRELESLLHV